MPYFHVQITHHKNQEFVVEAADAATAEVLAVRASKSYDGNGLSVLHLQDNHGSSISVADVDKAVWDDTLKKNKARTPQKKKAK